MMSETTMAIACQREREYWLKKDKEWSNSEECLQQLRKNIYKSLNPPVKKEEQIIIPF